jgi:methylase of polypeptide subunit release factors
MEFAAGPGFIAFALLGATIAERVTLVDINPGVVPAIDKTIQENGLQGKVEIRIGNGLQALGTEDKQFDLVVSNPPHIDVLDPTTGTIPYNDRPIIYSDPGFIIHREFYRNIGRFLARGG